MDILTGFGQKTLLMIFNTTAKCLFNEYGQLIGIQSYVLLVDGSCVPFKQKTIHLPPRLKTRGLS